MISMENKDKKYSLFLVEDDIFLVDMYTTKFSEYGFETVTSKNGAEALSKLEEGYVPDIILTDIVMPTMDGFEFLAELKKRNIVPGAIKIILSNLGQKDDIEKGEALGVKGYIIKSMSTPTETVKKVLDIVEKNS